MPDTFTEISSQSWLGRIGKSFKGILFGLLLIAGAGGLLFWNEGRAVQRIRALMEGNKVVLPVSAERVETANEGKLVHMTGLATTTAILTDTEFGVTTNALKLDRVAEMYQWLEKEEKKTEKNLGGSTTTTTTYTYQQAWEPQRVDSSAFHHREGHENPVTMLFQERSVVAHPITVGAFMLSSSLVGKISAAKPLLLTNSGQLKSKGQLVDGRVFIGTNAAAPQIGDQRISFRVTGPTTVSLVARQVGETFEPYRTKAGAAVELLQVGTLSAEEMFAHAREMNRLLTWGLRLLGWLLMFAGFATLFRPLVVLADVLPFLGNLVGVGTSAVAFLLATPISLLIVAAAWIVYRPLLGIALIAVAVAIPFALKSRFKKPVPPVAAGH